MEAEVEALFARAKGRGKQRSKAIDAKVVRWEWASGPLPGRAVGPFHDILVPPHGKLHRKVPTPKHGTMAYGFDAKERLLVARSHFSKTAFTEIQTTYGRDTQEWVTYRHDAALIGVGIARLVGGLPTKIRTRGWDGAWTEQTITAKDGRVVRVEVRSELAMSKVLTGYTLEATWTDDGTLSKLTRRHLGPKAPLEVVYSR